MEVDFVVLTRDKREINPVVVNAIQQQAGVRPIVHRVVGTPRGTSESRWQTIARARNLGKTLGQT